MKKKDGKKPSRKCEPLGKIIQQSYDPEQHIVQIVVNLKATREGGKLLQRIEASLNDEKNTK